MKKKTAALLIAALAMATLQQDAEAAMEAPQQRARRAATPRQ